MTKLVRSGEVGHIDLSIPRNTEVPNGIVTRINLRLETDLPFKDFFRRFALRWISRLMRQFWATSSPVTVYQMFLILSNPEELAVAMAKGIEKIKRARSRDVVMEIHNLVLCLSHVIYFGLLIYWSF